MNAMEEDRRDPKESAGESYMRDPWACYEDRDADCGDDAEAPEEDCDCCCCC